MANDTNLTRLELAEKLIETNRELSEDLIEECKELYDNGDELPPCVQEYIEELIDEGEFDNDDIESYETDFDYYEEYED